MFRTVRFLGLLLVCVLVLGAPPASAAGSPEPDGLSIRGVLAALWDEIVKRIPISGMEGTSLSGTDPGGGDPGEPNSGPGMDPNGKPPTGP